MPAEPPAIPWSSRNESTGYTPACMSEGEREFVRWLAARHSSRRGPVTLGIGDDMAMLDTGGQPILITSDMLLDGVHFDTADHSLSDIGHKAAACSLSDCAAMAVQPVAAVVSLALPRSFSVEQAKSLTDAIAKTCEAHGCELAVGDTGSWKNPLAIDVAMLARPYPNIAPVCRDGAQPGDGVFVTGPLGGSLLGKHLTFEPRVHEAKTIAETLATKLHAMIDVTDGLAIDLDRIAEASLCGAVLDESLLLNATATDAKRAADRDGHSVLEHVLGDGEDFELLLTGDVDDRLAARLGLLRIGVIATETGLRLRTANGCENHLEPTGYQHL